MVSNLSQIFNLNPDENCSVNLLICIPIYHWYLYMMSSKSINKENWRTHVYFVYPPPLLPAQHRHCAIANVELLLDQKGSLKGYDENVSRNSYLFVKSLSTPGQISHWTSGKKQKYPHSNSRHVLNFVTQKKMVWTTFYFRFLNRSIGIVSSIF